jgi:hypothetical protein
MTPLDSSMVDPSMNRQDEIETLINRLKELFEFRDLGKIKHFLDI